MLDARILCHVEPCFRVMDAGKTCHCSKTSPGFVELAAGGVVLKIPSAVEPLSPVNKMLTSRMQVSLAFRGSRIQCNVH